MEIQFLEWDTIHFGFKIGCFNLEANENVSLEELVNKAKEENYKLIYLKSPILINKISLFYDEKLVYSKSKDFVGEIFYSDIESYKIGLIEPEIYELALNSGEYSRYKLDDRFPVECFNLLYRKWIENSIFTDYATDVLVYRINNKPVGLMTYKNNMNISNIGIIAVNPNYQGYGIGTKLMKHYLSLLDDEITILDVVTQGVNIPARNFYEKNGYTITSRSYLYHLWL